MRINRFPDQPNADGGNPDADPDASPKDEGSPLSDAEIDKIQEKIDRGELSFDDVVNEPIDNLDRKTMTFKKGEPRESDKGDEGGDDTESEPKAPEGGDDAWQAEYLNENFPMLAKASGAKTIDELLATQEKGFSGMQGALKENAETKKMVNELGFDSVVAMGEHIRSMKPSDKPEEKGGEMFKAVDEVYDKLEKAAKDRDERELMAMDSDERPYYSRTLDTVRQSRDLQMKVANALHEAGTKREQKFNDGLNAMLARFENFRLNTMFQWEDPTTKKIWEPRKEELFNYLLNENPAALFQDDPLRVAMSALAGKDPGYVARAGGIDPDKKATKLLKLKQAELKKQIAAKYGAGKVPKSPTGEPGTSQPPKPPGADATDAQRKKYKIDLKNYQDSLLKPLESVSAQDVAFGE